MFSSGVIKSATESCQNLTTKYEVTKAGGQEGGKGVVLLLDGPVDVSVQGHTHMNGV